MKKLPSGRRKKLSITLILLALPEECHSSPSFYRRLLRYIRFVQDNLEERVICQNEDRDP